MFVPKGRARSSIFGAKHVDELDQAKAARAMHERKNSCGPRPHPQRPHTAQLAHWPARCTVRPPTCRDILPEMQAVAEEQIIARKEIGGMSFVRGARGAMSMHGRRRHTPLQQTTRRPGRCGCSHRVHSGYTKHRLRTRYFPLAANMELV